MSVTIPSSARLLSVHELSIGVRNYSDITGIADTKKLTHDVSFSISSGEIFSLVGESGSGKSITALACLGLLPMPGGVVEKGSICFDGIDVLKESPQKLMTIRGKDIAVIFQEPGAALNPTFSIGFQLREVFHYHDSNFIVGERIEYLLRRVGFEDPVRILKSYPHELSGGMQQRVMIAMALMLGPKILIADEPTTALDVTIQKQIMDLLLDIQEEWGMAILLITHNLALVSQYADRVAVMQSGRIVEENALCHGIEVLQHSYSRSLLESLPKL